MEIFVVGGAVRDVLLGQDPKDIDFVVVGATPQQMIRKGFTQVGADFPVFLDERGREFALARTERKVGSGHKGFETDFDPNVTLEEDLIRRDLTINAMAVRVEDWEDFFMGIGGTKFLIDPFGGADDIRRRRLRHVSEAFAEDPLRVLRVARFAARFGFAIDRDTLKLMSEIVDSGEVDDLTPERVWKEMSRAIMERHPHLFFDTLREVGATHTVSDDSFVFAGLKHRLPMIVEANTNEIERWMSIFFDLEEDVINDFINKHRVPTEIAKGIRFAFEMSTAIINRDVDDAMRIANKFRLWKDKIFLGEFNRIFSILEPTHAPFSRSMVGAIVKASEIGFESLTEKQRDRLTGPAIGKAIEKKRRAIVMQALTPIA